MSVLLVPFGGTGTVSQPTHHGVEIQDDLDQHGDDAEQNRERDDHTHDLLLSVRNDYITFYLLAE